MIFLSGCHNNYVIPPPKPLVDLPNKKLKIMLQTAPAAVRQMDPTTFALHLSDAQRHPVDGADVMIKLIMPAMDMGKNTIVTHPQGSGVYTGTGRFSMGGDWDVVVTASKGPVSAIQTFPLHVR